MKVWPVLGIAVLQVFLTLAHWFIFHTWISFWPMSPADAANLFTAQIALSFTFVLAAFLGFHYSNFLVELFYKMAAIWLGVLNFAFWAACLCWMVDLILRIALGAGHIQARPRVAAVLFGAALFTALYGMVNARRIRRREVTLTLPNLPASWRGRTALVVSDLHLGHVNGTGFARRIANLAWQINPDVIFIPGDLFDGSKADPEKLSEPLFQLAPPLGIYFCGGNHEEFGDAAAYEAAARRAGIYVLHNLRIEVDGLHIIGVPYSETVHPMRFRSYLDSLRLQPDQASILLNHVPNRLPIAEQAGVNLQLSGHTHGGQIFPFTLFTRFAFGKFTCGLQRFGKMQVLTSSGVGTWGPPMRVGSAPEVLLIRFA